VQLEIKLSTCEPGSLLRRCHIDTRRVLLMIVRKV